ncbi:MAG: TauD/TfdA family dioxygenase [Gammaproteobacteria bacterium]|jgi:alpha-ketoglutarate-dependent taurine dioxygenase|nr:TauD/TfdA family dioxygenase [Gammaproteobacteria bacterium]
MTSSQITCSETTQPGASTGPFRLENQSAYEAWRLVKLQDYPGSGNELCVDVDDVTNVSVDERKRILQRCNKANMAVYRSHNPTVSKDDLRQFCSQFGLQRMDHNLCADEDGISALHVVPKGTRQEYIPYSNHPINWHTDGYYNTHEHKIRAMVLHCVRPAWQGGDNALLDYEMVYMLIRDTNADFIDALMQDDVMCIPANVQNGKEIRPAQSGPVFSVDPLTANLHMRYTARTRSIEWKKDTITQRAVQCLEEVLRTANDYIFQMKLQPGQGVISNNVLHTRTAFTDGEQVAQQRMIFRARFYDRITNTDI